MSKAVSSMRAGAICEATKRFQTSLYRSYSSFFRKGLTLSGGRSRWAGRMAS
jgi:hypothetical protein